MYTLQGAKPKRNKVKGKGKPRRSKANVKKVIKKNKDKSGSSVKASSSQGSVKNDLAEGMWLNSSLGMLENIKDIIPPEPILGSIVT